MENVHINPKIPFLSPQMSLFQPRNGSGLAERIRILNKVWDASYREIATLFGISKAMAWRIANQNYEPKDPEIRRKLGFPTMVITYQGPDGKFVKYDLPERKGPRKDPEAGA